MEYKVLSGPFNAGKLESDLNGHAAEGWRVAGTFQAARRAGTLAPGASRSSRAACYLSPGPGGPAFDRPGPRLHALIPTSGDHPDPVQVFGLTYAYVHLSRQNIRRSERATLPLATGLASHKSEQSVSLACHRGARQNLARTVALYLHPAVSARAVQGGCGASAAGGRLGRRGPASHRRQSRARSGREPARPQAMLLRKQAGVLRRRTGQRLVPRRARSRGLPGWLPAASTYRRHQVPCCLPSAINFRYVASCLHLTGPGSRRCQAPKYPNRDGEHARWTRYAGRCRTEGTERTEDCGGRPRGDGSARRIRARAR